MYNPNFSKPYSDEEESITVQKEVDTLFQIRSRFASLSKSNKKIANYILNNYDKIPSTTISQLSSRLNVSPPTITRFCQILGFSGYPAFKYHITSHPSSFTLENKRIMPGESTLSIKNKICSIYSQMVNETIALVDERALSTAAEKISRANHICFFSQGGSGVSAQFGQLSFIQIGIPCQCYNDMTISKFAAAELTEKDVAIAISYSGSAKVPVDALRIAKQKKAATIGITGFSNSPLLRYSTIHLCYNAKVDDDMQFMHIARICEMEILGLLHSCVLSRNYDRTIKKIDSLKKAMLDGRY